CDLEPLPAPAIRHRRLPGAVVRRLSRAEPLDGLWAVPEPAVVAGLLAGGDRAIGADRLGARLDAAGARLRRPAAARSRRDGGAVPVHHAAVAVGDFAHRHLRGARGARGLSADLLLRGAHAF